MHRVAIYPGTFDPITYGHCDIIRRAVKLFGHLIIAIAEHTGKKTLFTTQERLQMVQEELTDLGDHVEVTSFSGLLTDFMIKHKAEVLVRGLRTASDFEFEFQMAYINQRAMPNIETVLLPSTRDSLFISSTFVREIGVLGGDLTGLASSKVVQKLKNKRHV